MSVYFDKPLGASTRTTSDAPDRCDVCCHWLRDSARCECKASVGTSSSSKDSGVHPDDLAVDRFAARMKAKLASARKKGRGGWDDPAQCSLAILSAMFHDHVAKGYPIDVANFAMMIEHYGAAITPFGYDVAAMREDAAKAVEGLRRETPYDYNQPPCTTTMKRGAAAIRALPLSTDASPDSGGAIQDALQIIQEHIDDVTGDSDQEPHARRAYAAIADLARSSPSPPIVKEAGEDGLRTVVYNDALIFATIEQRMRECWIGTGRSSDDGSASNDFREWMNEAHNRQRNLKAALGLNPNAPLPTFAVLSASNAAQVSK